jgi:hypothetical protein
MTKQDCQVFAQHLGDQGYASRTKDDRDKGSSNMLCEPPANGDERL